MIESGDPRNRSSQRALRLVSLLIVTALAVILLIQPFGRTSRTPGPSASPDGEALASMVTVPATALPSPTRSSKPDLTPTPTPEPGVASPAYPRQSPSPAIGVPAERATPPPQTPSPSPPPSGKVIAWAAQHAFVADEDGTRVIVAFRVRNETEGVVDLSRSEAQVLDRAGEAIYFAAGQDHVNLLGRPRLLLPGEQGWLIGVDWVDYAKPAKIGKLNLRYLPYVDENYMEPPASWEPLGLDRASWDVRAGYFLGDVVLDGSSRALFAADDGKLLKTWPAGTLVALDATGHVVAVAEGGYFSSDQYDYDASVGRLDLSDGTPVRETAIESVTAIIEAPVYEADSVLGRFPYAASFRKIALR